MDLNPYQSPREIGYLPPKQPSRWWDFVACVVTALLIHAVVQAAGQAYRISGLDWSGPFQTKAFKAILVLLGIAYVALMIVGLLVLPRRRRNIASASHRVGTRFASPHGGTRFGPI